MKVCTKCNKTKNEDEFFWKNKEKNKLHSICKECKRNIDKNSYKKSGERKSKIRYNAIEAVKRNKNFLKRVKQRMKCSKCGDIRSYILDFHHLNNKEFGVSELANRGCSLEKLKKEIRKCIPLCANCHREEHYLKGD